MNLTFDFPKQLDQPVNQKAKILKALIENPYISEGEDFPRMNGFRMRLSELRKLLQVKGVTIHKATHEFQGEFESGWMYRHFLLIGDHDKARELYLELNK